MSREKRGESSTPAESGKKPAAARAKKAAPAGKGPALPAALTEDERAVLLAKAATSPSLNASAVMESFQKNIVGEEVKAHHLREAVSQRVQDVWKDDLRPIEAMLMAQAMALQTMFTSLTRRAAIQNTLPQYQTHMALGLKAQAQSRATLQALIDLKQPRHAPTFIKQANVAHGHQQVNNGAAGGSAPLAQEEFPTAQSKLLEANPSPSFEPMSKGVNDERLEQRAPRAAG